MNPMQNFSAEGFAVSGGFERSARRTCFADSAQAVSVSMATLGGASSSREEFSVPDDFDALDCAREQLAMVLQELVGTDVLAALRVQVGLLAAQVALAERLPRQPKASSARRLAAAAAEPGPVRVLDHDGEADEWDVDLIERILHRAKPSGMALIRAMVAEGGRISTERLRETSGLKSFAPMTNAINRACFDRDRPRPAIGLVRQHHATRDPGSRVVAMYFPPDVLPLVVATLNRVDRHRAAEHLPPPTP